MTSFILSFTRYLAVMLMIVSVMSTTIFSLIGVSVSAAYVEMDTNSFIGYKRVIEGALQDMEREFRVNNTLSDATISNIRNLVQEAYIRLPDSGDAATKNDSLKKSTDLYLDLAAKNKNSSTHASNAASQVARFLTDASIAQISGSINANPSNGNAPLTSSFLATAKDPSGINIPDNNYIWWMREAGGYRRELGRGPSLTYTFSKEGNYQVFLDVVSESRNKKGKTDVTPLTLSQDIEVKPRLGNVILLINGVNVSNIDTLKVSPTLGKIGLLFDATASRAVSNGVITKTKWDFGNGNILEYDGAPILEKQLYVNPEMYKVILEITTNQGQTFRKQMQLLIRDPAAIISLDKEVGYINEDISMSAKSYLTNATNVEYTWEVQDINDAKKIISSKVGSTFNYKFKKVGQYLISLTTRNPNGNTDSDSRIIIIESRSPIINLDTPKPISPEKPNTILFDASRTYDPDTNNAKGLIYEWTIDGEKIILNDSQKDGSIGTYSFKDKGTHTVSLTVSNSFGKVSTVDKTFEVLSTLTVGVNISPRATPIGSMIGFQARSPDARFFEWDLGDGSPTVNGTSDYIQHIYKKTGIYSVSLSVKNADGTQENRISRKVYITDTDKPYALIDIKTLNGTAIEDATACENPDGAFIVNRAENTTLDGSNSINIDGNSAGLIYTWRYMDRVKTGPSISEKFTELGCYPIELNVKSQKNGSSHTSKRYIQIKNIEPKVTSVDATIDTTKKDTQKLIVNVVANGARDDDGVITSYIWFYTTESDPEKQNVRITQNPSTTFVLPNVTEKYYFGVIAEDNDGARYDTSESTTEQKPLLVANDDANINMPLISLNLSKSQVFTDEVVNFTVKAKNILGTDITEKSEYLWDFDGDSRIDQKTTVPNTNFTYKKSGKYNMKVKVVNNGISNTKYQTIYVKNELKASVVGYRMGDMTYFVNTSRGVYDSAKWLIGGVEGGSMYSSSIKTVLTNGSGSIGNLTIKYGANEISSIDISGKDIQDMSLSHSGGIYVQSFPALIGDTITINAPGDKLLLSMYGNAGKSYHIDTDLKIDSDIDTISDNDIDNKESPSYEDGSVFIIDNFGSVKTRTKDMRMSIIGQNGQTIGTKDIKVIFDFIAEGKDEVTTEISSTGSEGFSTIDKENLDKLQSIIRTMSPEDRIIFTQYYNNLIENWGDLNDRTEGLLHIQKEVNAAQTLDEKMKADLSDIIDLTLIGDAQAINDVSIASHVIEGLIPSNNSNRSAIIERLEKIKANPANLAENKVLGKEILEMIQNDSAISTENKLLIKSQLLTIINGGQESVPEEEKTAIAEESIGGGGFIGFIGGTVKIFLIIIIVIIALFFIGYIAYRLSRKKGDMGFQDFLIDSIAHTKGSRDTSTIQPEITPKNTLSDSIIIAPPTVDPLIAISEEKVSGTSSVDPLSVSEVHKTEDEQHPNTPTEESPTAESPIIQQQEASQQDTTANIPDWLKAATTPVEIKPAMTSSYRNKDDSASIVIEKKSAPEESMEITVEKDETPLVEVIPESPVEAIPIIVTPDTPPETEPKAQDIEEKTASAVENKEDSGDAIIPDWLLPEGSNTSSEDFTQEDVISDSVPVVLPPSPDAELPDWLKNSLDTETPENKNEVLGDTGGLLGIDKEEKPKKKKALLPKKKIEKKNPGNNATHDDIPDWLK